MIIRRSGVIAILHLRDTAADAVFPTRSLVTVRRRHIATTADATATAVHTPPDLRLAAAHSRPAGCWVAAVAVNREEQILIAVVDVRLRHHRKRVLIFTEHTRLRLLHAAARCRRHLARP